MLNTAFIVFRPIQIIIALAIIKQLGCHKTTVILIVNDFSEAYQISQRMKEVAWKLGDVQVDFCESRADAYRFILSKDIIWLNIHYDRGLSHYLHMLSLKIRTRNRLRIRVFEEGNSINHAAPSVGFKKFLRDLLGVGTYSGGCALTECVFVFQVEEYKALFNSKKPVIQINTRPMKLIQDEYVGIHAVFNYSPLIDRRDGIGYIYLSDWRVDYDFLRVFSKLSGDKYIKPHPFHRNIKLESVCKVIPASIPVELVVTDFMSRYESIVIYHHGSSAEQYVDADNVKFILIPTVKS